MNGGWDESDERYFEAREREKKAQKKADEEKSKINKNKPVSILINGIDVRGKYTGFNWDSKGQNRSVLGKFTFNKEDHVYEGTFGETNKKFSGKRKSIISEESWRPDGIFTYGSQVNENGFKFYKGDKLEGNFGRNAGLRDGTFKLTRKIFMRNKESILEFKNNELKTHYKGVFDEKTYEPSGKGIMTFYEDTNYGNYAFKEGDNLKGNWKDGKLYGYFKLTRESDKSSESILKFENGKFMHHYEGDFTFNHDSFEPSGQGKIIYNASFIYDGGIEKGKKHGAGKLIQNIYDYEGEWEQDKVVKRGKIKFKNVYNSIKYLYKAGDTLEGEWKDKLKGKYKLTRMGNESILEFDDNSQVSEYKGAFDEETFEASGEGILTFYKYTNYGNYNFYENDTLEGNWENGMLKEGEIYALTHAPGEIKTLKFKDGKLKDPSGIEDLNFNIGGYLKTKRTKRKRKCRKNKLSRKKKKCRKNKLSRKKKKNKKRTQRR